MQWYGDNSELNGIWDAELPDILIFGGIAVRKPAIPELKRTISTVKKKYSERQPSEVLLELYAPVHRDQGIVLVPHTSEQLAVRDSRPAPADDRVNCVAFEGRGEV